MLGLTPRTSQSLEWCIKVCISVKVLGDIAGLGTTLERGTTLETISIIQLYVVAKKQACQVHCRFKMYWNKKMG